MQGWLKTIQDPYPYRTWDKVIEGLSDLSLGPTSVGTKNKYNVPSSLSNDHISGFKTWVSEEWASLPNGVHPLTPEWEEKIVKSLICELNSFFDLELGKEPSCDRLATVGDSQQRPDILMISASHGIRVSNILADRGYSVTICGRPGWRALKGTVKEMAEKVEESLGNMRTSDIVVVQILDSSSYMARTEEGGDLPICQFANGEFHVVGELVYAGKEKQLHLLKTILPILRLLENRRVIFMVPLLRYVVNACCADEEHLTNGGEPGFEERFRSELAESRKNYKDFLFCHGLRGFRVVDANYVLPNRGWTRRRRDAGLMIQSTPPHRGTIALWMCWRQSSAS
jgi:hypothetical protein